MKWDISKVDERKEKIAFWATLEIKAEVGKIRKLILKIIGSPSSAESPSLRDVQKQLISSIKEHND